MTTIIDGSAGITFPSGSNPQAAPSKVLQVVQATYSTVTTNNTNVFADTGLTATITPLFSTSKILILISHAECYKSSSALSSLGLNICKNGSQIVQFTYDTGTNVGQTFTNYFSVSYVYQDSPATTSATTYKTQFKNTETNANQVAVQANSMPSTITLMEIAA